MCDVIMEAFRRISIRIKEKEAIELVVIKEKQEKETGKQVTMAELVREFIRIGMKAKKDATEAETNRIKEIQKKQEEKEPVKQVQKVIESVRCVDIERLEDKMDDVEHEVNDMKEMLQNILTTVSYPKELEKINKMQESIEFIVSCINK